MTNDLHGKMVVVTGATSGIGLAAVKTFTQSGAFVIGVGRSESNIRTAREAVLMENPGANVTYLLADLANQIEVKALASKISLLLQENHYLHLDVLVNNAGVYLEKKRMTIDGIEMTFAVNHLAPFLLTHELLPFLLRAERGRVLTVSSYSHFTTPLTLNRIVDPSPYIGLLAYKRSKLCNVLFTYELNRRNDAVTAFAVDPGLVNTAIASKESHGISHIVWRRRREKGSPPEVPARTLIYLTRETKIDISQGYYFYNCAFKEPSRKARRVDLAEDLWALSKRLTGIK